MIRRWPYLYLVAVLLPTLFLAGCDQQSSEPFSVEVRVETQQGEPVRDASVGVRPCSRENPCGTRRSACARVTRLDAN
ncbi:MAG: hypothetical protein BRD34_04460 [Bacteroidetes bacterium QH_6_64_77]|nr:MAG: hypothetical protein BRD34_04460 [Bacteroidetes bacterium QH_6_64_77]